jgi:hypothetical protein
MVNSRKMQQRMSDYGAVCVYLQLLQFDVNKVCTKIIINLHYKNPIMVGGGGGGGEIFFF